MSENKHTVIRRAINNNGNKEPTFVLLSHDGVAQRQRSQELRAEGTLLSSQPLHQAGGRHGETAARVRIPAQVHGLLTRRERGAAPQVTQPRAAGGSAHARARAHARMKRRRKKSTTTFVSSTPTDTSPVDTSKGHYLNI